MSALNENYERIIFARDRPKSKICPQLIPITGECASGDGVGDNGRNSRALGCGYPEKVTVD